MTLTGVTDPAAVREVLRRPHDFAPDNALTAVEPIGPDALRVLARAGFALPPVLASASGELHARTRRAVLGFFSPGRVEEVREFVEHATLARLEGPGGIRSALVGGGAGDLLGGVTRHVAPAVLARLTGVAFPAPDVLDGWSRDALELFWGKPDAARQVELAASCADLYRWLRAAARESAPEDLFGALRATGLDERGVCSAGFFLAVAGQQTTSWLAAIALHRALTSGPKPERRLAGTAAATAFVRDTLAHTSSVPAWRRVAVHDTDLLGRRVPAGTELLLTLVGAHGPHPGPRAGSLAFGHGEHRCVGAGLAELQAAVVLATVLRALPPLELAAEPEWVRLTCFRAPDRVLVRSRNRGGLRCDA